MSISRLDTGMSGNPTGFGSSFSPYAGAAGGLGLAGLAQLLFPYKDPSRQTARDISKIPGKVAPYFNPYIEAGQRTLPHLESEYGTLMTSPEERLNKIGGGYQQSPGFQFQLQQALQAAKNAAAAGGMSGSPQHEQQAMDVATGLASKDYNQFLQNALKLYGLGLGGEGGLVETGYGAGKELSDTIGNMALQKALLEYQGRAAEQQAKQSAIGNVIGGAGTLASGFLFG